MFLYEPFDSELFRSERLLAEMEEIAPSESGWGLGAIATAGEERAAHLARRAKIDRSTASAIAL